MAGGGAAGVGGDGEFIAGGRQRRAGGRVDGGGGTNAGPAGAAGGVVDRLGQRGVLLVAGGDFAGNARELVGYAELVAAADPAAAERAREQAGAARARLN